MPVTARYVALLATLISVSALNTAEAQVSVSPRIRAEGGVVRAPDGAYSVFFGGENRAVIGITMSNSARSDTAGVRVDDVTKDSPADKAGIKEGDRLTSINGISLKTAPADADDPEMQGIGQRRLTRELGKVKPGDEVELRVSTNGQSRTTKVKTVSAADLSRMEPRNTIASFRDDLDKRAALGISIGSSGSVRDTLGLFISSVTTNGPAEMAGVVEGDRIASINGIDVRVPREDVEDGAAASIRMNRFTREIGKLAPGDKANLRVYSDGHYRDVAVTAGKASELNSGFRINIGDGPGNMMFSLPRGSAGGTITLPGRAPQVYRYDGGGIMLNGQPLRSRESLERAMTELRARMETLHQRFNDDSVEPLPNGGMRIRSRTPSMVVPSVPQRSTLRRAQSAV